MTTTNSFISDSQLFAKCKAELERICRTERQLPEQVFEDRFNCFVYEEFDWAMSEDFWATLQVLARESGDESLLISILDPDPVDYYKKEFRYYNWALISAASTADEYWTLLNDCPEESPADSMLANSERIVWAARSGAWVVWGERSLGICILACLDGKLAKSVSWHDLDWVLRDILPDLFRGGEIPTGFTNQIRGNYS